MKKLITSMLIMILLLGVSPAAMWDTEYSIAHANQVATEKTLKGSILSELGNYKTEFSVDYEGDFSNIKAVLQNAMQTIQVENQYIYENVAEWNVGMKYKGNTGTLSFKIKYLTDKEKEEYVTAHVKKILPDLVDKKASQIDKVKAVHDYIVLNSTYSSKTKNSQYSTYTLLTEGKGVCQAYALLMLKMLEELKIEAKYVKGNSNNERHAWILVNVDKQWYHVDPTWADPVGNKDDEVRYKFFMLTDKQIAATHTWTQADYPAAKSEKYKSFHVATQAYTMNNQLYYLNEQDKKYYQMNLKTLKATAITGKDYQEGKKSYVAAKK